MSISKALRDHGHASHFHDSLVVVLCCNHSVVVGAETIWLQSHIFTLCPFMESVLDLSSSFCSSFQTCYPCDMRYLNMATDFIFSNAVL